MWPRSFNIKVKVVIIQVLLRHQNLWTKPKICCSVPSWIRFLHQKAIVSCSWITMPCVLYLGYPVQLSCRVNNSVASSPWIDVWLAPWHQNFLPTWEKCKQTCMLCLPTSNSSTVSAALWLVSRSTEAWMCRKNTQTATARKEQCKRSMGGKEAGRPSPHVLLTPSGRRHQGGWSCLRWLTAKVSLQTAPRQWQLPLQDTTRIPTTDLHQPGGALLRLIQFAKWKV